MRKRRRNRSTWFPILGFDQTEGGRPPTSWDARSFGVLASGAPNIIALPLIPDDTRDPSDAVFAGDYSLRDYVEGQTCIIERIVGKIWWNYQLNYTAGEEADQWNQAIACSAVAVLPVSDDSSVPEVTSDDYNPLAATNQDKPYLWRRSWVLGMTYVNQSLTFPPTGVSAFYHPPDGNWRYGSVLDGPHIDTKGTKRAIRKNERLFLIHAVQGIQTFDGETVAELDGFATCTTDVRVLGRMTHSKNRSLFK